MANVNIDVEIVNTAALRALSRLEASTNKVESSLKNVGVVGKNSFDRISRAAGPGGLASSVFKGVIAVDLFRKSIGLITNAAKDLVKSLADVETATIGVEKTTNITGTALKELVNDFDKLSTTIPVSTTDLLDLAKSAGQLGIKGKGNIKKFTEVVAKLGFATDISGEEAAKSLARILNVTGESAQEVDKLGAVIVELGNNFAASESEIVSVTTEVARATAQFNVTSAEATALGASLKAMGIQAAGGGTAVGKVFREIGTAIAEEGSKLKEFAEITGLTAKELKTQFADNATKVFELFIKGLNQSGLSAGELTVKLKELGLGQDRTAKVLPPLIKGYDQLKNALNLANAQVEDAVALDNEAEKAFKSLNAEFNIAVNTVSRLARSIFQNLIPALKFILKEGSFVARFWANVFDPGPIRESEKELKSLTDRAAFLRKQIEKAPVPQFAKPFIAELAKIEPKIEQVKAKLNKLKGQQTSPQEDTKNKIVNIDEDPVVKNLIARNDKVAQIEEETRLIKEEQDKINADNRFSIEQINELRIIELKRQAALNTIKDKKLLNKTLTDLDIEKAKTEQKIELNSGKDLINARNKTLNTFATLGRSSNKTLAAIGKAAAITQIAIATPPAVASAIKWGTELGGPPLGAIFAGITKVAMAAQAAQVAGLSFEQGGIVPGSSFTGDNVQAQVNSGEMILNRQQQSQLFNVANGKISGGQGQEIVVNTVVQVEEETIARAVSRQVANGFELGEQV